MSLISTKLTCPWNAMQRGFGTILSVLIRKSLDQEEDSKPLSLELPIIRFFEIEDFQWKLIDGLSGRELAGEIDKAQLSNSSKEKNGKTQLVVTGSIAEEALELIGDFNAPESVPVVDSIPFSIRGGLADASLSINGSMTSPQQNLQIDSSIRVVVPDLPRVAELLQITVPFQKPIEGRLDLKGQGDIWEMPLIELQVGRSVAYGDAKVNLSNSLPRLSFVLNSPYLLIDDFIAPATKECHRRSC